MGKFRSKLKRNGKGKTWSRGESATSNPTQMKHRMKAKSRFFQPNLSLGEFFLTCHLMLAPVTKFLTAAATTTGLTMEAVHKHEQSQAFNAETTTVNDVAGSLRSFKLDDDDDGMSGSGTAPTGTAPPAPSKPSRPSPPTTAVAATHASRNWSPASGPRPLFTRRCWPF